MLFYTLPPRKSRASPISLLQYMIDTTWWLIPRIVSGLVHPSFLSGLTLQKSHVNHWGELIHLRAVGSSPPSSRDTSRDVHRQYI